MAPASSKKQLLKAPRNHKLRNEECHHGSQPVCSVGWLFGWLVVFNTDYKESFVCLHNDTTSGMTPDVSVTGTRCPNGRNPKNAAFSVKTTFRPTAVPPHEELVEVMSRFPSANSARTSPTGSEFTFTWKMCGILSIASRTVATTQERVTARYKGLVEQCPDFQVRTVRARRK